MPYGLTSLLQSRPAPNQKSPSPNRNRASSRHQNRRHAAQHKECHLHGQETAETGCSFKELQIEARLNYASALLRTTGLPVAQLARECGFATLPNFHRQFKEKFDKTPLEYRKTFSKE